LLAHFFIKNEKINLLKVIGVSIGFAGIVYLFSDNFLINENNLFSALCILIGSLGYVIGGILTLKISNKKNENVTASILIWATIILLPICFYFEKPWNYSPSLISVISITYLGIIATGLAWVLRFKILKDNGLVFQSQVAYLIPIFGVILGYVFLDELITFKVLVALIAIIIGIYFVKKSTSSRKILSQKNI
jgi:drug/metabolite transporter (DMT)-like permease